MRFIAVAGAVLVLAVQVGAETYSWVDEQGTYNFTEDLSKVPRSTGGR